MRAAGDQFQNPMEALTQKAAGAEGLSGSAHASVCPRPWCLLGLITACEQDSLQNRCLTRWWCDWWHRALSSFPASGSGEQNLGVFVGTSSFILAQQTVRGKATADPPHGLGVGVAFITWDTHIVITFLIWQNDSLPGTIRHGQFRQQSGT